MWWHHDDFFCQHYWKTGLLFLDNTSIFFERLYLDVHFRKCLLGTELHCCLSALQETSLVIFKSMGFRKLWKIWMLDDIYSWWITCHVSLLSVSNIHIYSVLWPLKYLLVDWKIEILLNIWCSPIGIIISQQSQM